MIAGVSTVNAMITVYIEIFLEILICLHKSLTIFKYILWMNIVIR